MTTTIILQSPYPGLPRWAGTRRNSRSPTHTYHDLQNHALLASYICYDPWHPLCYFQFMCL